MKTRREFVQSAGPAGAAMLATATTAQAQAASHAGDKLLDDSGKYAAAPLPFALDALEPVIDAKTVELHDNFHHKPAAVAANNAEATLSRARGSDDFALVKFYEKELAFQLSSHILHTIYWTNLGTKGAEPEGDLAKAIVTNFGSRAKFKSPLVAAGIAVEASGRGLLGDPPTTRELMILQCENHQKLTAWGVVPLLAVDVFEHAYHLKSRNRRPKYVNAPFGIVKWNNLAERCDAARSRS